MPAKRISKGNKASWLSSEAQDVLKVQFPLTLALSVLLTVGYSMQRQWQAVAERDHLQLLLVGWDGWEWLVWPLAAPAIVYLIRRFPLLRGQVGRNLGYLTGCSVLLYLVVANLRMLLRLLPNIWLPPNADLPLGARNYLMSIMVMAPLDFVTYSAIFAVTLAIDYHFRNRSRQEEALRLELRGAQLESDLAQAELKALRGQLHPHFLFNSFNAVTTLLRQRRNEAAVEMIAQLSMLLRLAIDRAGKHEFSLETELDFVQRYLEVERIRFGDKLQLKFEVESGALPGIVPNLMLQPLVENAIKHGISRRTRTGIVRLAARRVDDRMIIEIENDGPDETMKRAPRPASSGIGLANTRARLEKIYHNDYQLDMAPRADGGMRIEINLPWRDLAA